MVAACRKAAWGRRQGHLALYGNQLTFSGNHGLRAHKSQVVLKRENSIDSVVRVVFTDLLQASSVMVY